MELASSESAWRKVTAVGLLAKLFSRFQIDIVIQRAIQREWRGDLEGAIQELEEAIRTEKPTPARLKALALLLLKAGRTEVAATTSANALAMAPGQPELIVSHSRLLRRVGRFEEALPLISSRYNKDKRNIFVASEYCKLLVDLGRHQEAAAVLDEVDRWFKSRADSRRMEENGMTQAYREAQAKLKQRARRPSGAQARPGDDSVTMPESPQ